MHKFIQNNLFYDYHAKSKSSLKLLCTKAYLYRKCTPIIVWGQVYWCSFQIPSAEIQRHSIMSFLCMSTYAGGTKLRFRWVNGKYQNYVWQLKECHPVLDLTLCYWYPVYLKIIHKLYLISQYLWHYTR